MLRKAVILFAPDMLLRSRRPALQIHVSMLTTHHDRVDEP